MSADLPPVLINGTGNISPSVNGTRTTSTSLFFNGIDATNITSNEGSMSDNISPAPEMLEEVKLQTSLYDASTGRSAAATSSSSPAAARTRSAAARSINFQHENFNANDFFYEKDGIDKPKARRNEGGFTIGGPLRRNKLFFFGGYQRTDAETGFVPTASSITVLPAALRLIDGARTKENLLAAFSRAEPGHHGSRFRRRSARARPTRACISDVAVALFNLRNPKTGDFVIPAPREGIATRRRTTAATGSVGGNPLVRQRNVVPAEFKQDQFTLQARRAADRQPAAERHVLLRRLPRLRSVPRPVIAGVAVHAASARTRTPRSPHPTTGCSAATRSTRSAAACSTCETRGRSTTRSTA